MKNQLTRNTKCKCGWIFFK